MTRHVIRAAARCRRARWAALPAALLVAGCSSSAPDAELGTPNEAPMGAMPSSHVHGAAIDPADGTLLLATHDGLFQVTDDGRSTRVGPVIDLMGFAVAATDRFLASGHPGPGVDLPQPVGLIESTDGGQTWEPVSRQGESDFHALTTGPSGVLGFDGSLLSSSDGQDWETLTIPATPFTLAAAPVGDQTLATTEQGLLRSRDGGRSWEPVANAPLLQVVAWDRDGGTAAGVTPQGRVWTSADAAISWTEGAELGDTPQAVAVDDAGDGSVRIAVVTAGGVFESLDGGRTFESLLVG